MKHIFAEADAIESSMQDNITLTASKFGPEIWAAQSSQAQVISQNNEAKHFWSLGLQLFTI